MKLRHTETVGFHHFKAADRTFRQPHRSQPHAQIIHPVARHQDSATALRMLVRDVHLGQLRDDRTTVLVTQIGIQHAVVGLAAHDHPGNRNHDDQHQAHCQSYLLCALKVGKTLHPDR